MRVLFCGGSHMASFRNFIRSEKYTVDCQFLVTAGKYQYWSASGNRFKVDGSKVKNLYKQKPEFTIDLSGYDQIIFVGQALQPHRCFWGDQPLSKSIIDKILDPDFFPLYMRSFGKTDKCDDPKHCYFFNEPLSLFPKLATQKCTLIDDPFPRHPSFKSVPVHAKQLFREAVGRFCDKNQIQRIEQPQETFTSNMNTSDVYAVENRNDYTHVNSKYWKIVWENLRILFPEIRSDR